MYPETKDAFIERVVRERNEAQMERDRQSRLTLLYRNGLAKAEKECQHLRNALKDALQLVLDCDDAIHMMNGVGFVNAQQFIERYGPKPKEPELCLFCGEAHEDAECKKELA